MPVYTCLCLFMPASTRLCRFMSAQNGCKACKACNQSNNQGESLSTLLLHGHDGLAEDLFFSQPG